MKSQNSKETIWPPADQVGVWSRWSKFALLSLGVLLLISCSKSTAPTTSQNPQFNIMSQDVVTSIVTTVTGKPHVAEIEFTFTEEFPNKYDKFMQEHSSRGIDLLANGKKFQSIVPPPGLSTQMIIYIFSSPEEAQSIADSLNKNGP